MQYGKIINDPVHGFINIPTGLIQDVVSHKYFQRLRHITQLGLTSYVYPGATHTRFHHALGAMHLMGQALTTIEDKGTPISDTEREAAMVAILLHDVGHGPFSHTLEHFLVSGISHEEISLLLMHQINKDLGGRLDLAIQIFEGNYPRKFFHQLVSSQLDVDRLDYLQRDAFFTGVKEGNIGSTRIIKMLTVIDDEVLVEEKAIYSLENFLVSRRLMYWQVYFHKATVSAESMLVQIIMRAKLFPNMFEDGVPASLLYFLNNDVTLEGFKADATIIQHFITLDDHDLWVAIKAWANSHDVILSYLASNLIGRNLLAVTIQEKPFSATLVNATILKVAKALNLSIHDAQYLVYGGTINNEAYVSARQNIKILKKNGQIVEISQASDLATIKSLTTPVSKHYLCRPKSVSL